MSVCVYAVIHILCRTQTPNVMETYVQNCVPTVLQNNYNCWRFLTYVENHASLCSDGCSFGHLVKTSTFMFFCFFVFFCFFFTGECVHLDASFEHLQALLFVCFGSWANVVEKVELQNMFSRQVLTRSIVKFGLYIHVHGHTQNCVCVCVCGMHLICAFSDSAGILLCCAWS